MAQQHISAGTGTGCATGLRPVATRQAGNSVESASFTGSSDHVRCARKPGGHFGAGGNSPWQLIPTSSFGWAGMSFVVETWHDSPRCRQLNVGYSLPMAAPRALSMRCPILGKKWGRL